MRQSRIPPHFFDNRVVVVRPSLSIVTCNRSAEAFGNERIAIFLFIHFALGNDVVVISSKANQKRTSAKWDPGAFLVKF